MNKNANERGSALVYILIAIALLAALTVAFMNPSSNQTSSQNAFRTVSEIQTQVDFIRAAVQECVLQSSLGSRVAGDTTINNTSGGTDPGASKLYPIKPDSTHLTAAVAAPNREVRNLRCPSDPGDDPDHAPIFGGNTGKFLAPPPNLFGEWQWYNGADGVFFFIGTSATDAFIDAVLEKLNASYGTCEVDVIDATAGDVPLDMDSTVVCPDGSKCFRVWMIADTTVGVDDVEDGAADPQVAHYPDPDAAETAANCDRAP